MSVMLLALLLIEAAPTPLDCLDAFRKRNALAARMGALLTREAERGQLNPAERGALNAAIKRRERLLDCPPDRDL